MAIRDLACEYRRLVRWECGKRLMAIIGLLVVELRPAEALALAGDELHCDVCVQPLRKKERTLTNTK